MSNIAQGAPTKEFFVGMLTRDIDLNDSILDLLDNCLDGVVRQKNGETNRRASDFYNGFYAHITVTKSSFTIEDNCGGIPRAKAENYAFRMGRSNDTADDELPTVGIYGIGMKRAIFKIGQSACVITRNETKLYQVTIPLEWASSADWNFAIDELDDATMLKDGGTRVQINNINPDIFQKWNTEDKLYEFKETLIKSIQQCYSFIIQKGFQIVINGDDVNPLPVHLLLSKNGNGSSIAPFLYQESFNDVNVSLVLGFNAPPSSPDEIDDENLQKRSSSDAGWTVICNDRVVLYNDKSHLTGWGEAGVPHYHTQFIGIRGIVVFESNNPAHLPMTTTKRGVDTSSSMYAAVKDRMRQGLKMFTDYTNKWKGRNESEREYSKAAEKVLVNTFLENREKIEADTFVRFRAVKKGVVSIPKLPQPLSDKTYCRISFSKDLESIKDIIQYFYMDRALKIAPSKVGEDCFNFVLEQAQHKAGE